MGMIYKFPLTPQQIWNKKTFGRVLELWQYYLIGSSTDIAAVIAGTYYPVGGDGEGELNGLPTAEDIAAIVAENYTHHDVEIDEYGFESVPSADTVSEIIAGTYIPQSSSNESAFEGNVSADDIADIIGRL